MGVESPATTKAANSSILTALKKFSERTTRLAAKTLTMSRPTITALIRPCSNQPGCCAGKKTGAIAAEGIGVDRKQHHIAEQQQDVGCSGDDAAAERLVQKGHRAAFSRVTQRQLQIRVTGEQRHDPCDQKGDGGGALGDLHRESGHGEDTAAHHAADADRQGGECT
jgi:hypothetical protein